MTVETSEQRAITLLKATRELLLKCNEGYYVKSVLEETVFYDEAECDGYCLMEDIGYLLEEVGELKPGDVI